jgi:ribonuclease HI
VEPTAFCDLCGAEQETIKHVLTDCTIAKLFWREIKLLTGIKLPNLHLHSWASDILRPDVCLDKERGLFTIGMYALWTQRNRRRHGEDQLTIKHAVKWAVDLAHDLWELSNEKKKVKPTIGQQKWRPPPVGWFKCNVDGAFAVQNGRGATWVVLWDADGTFQGGRARWYSHGLDALMMEALACRDGVQFTREQGVPRVPMETDCQELANMWARGGNQRSHVAPIIRDIIELSSSFNDFTLMYASRSCNRVAHVLAKQGNIDDNSLSVEHTSLCHYSF